jgi:hypothetical protein
MILSARTRAALSRSSSRGHSNVELASALAEALGFGGVESGW